MFTKTLFLSALFCLAGCIGDQANRQQVNQPPLPINVPINIAPSVPPDVNKADLNQLRSETVASNIW